MNKVVVRTSLLPQNEHQLNFHGSTWLQDTKRSLRALIRLQSRLISSVPGLREEDDGVQLLLLTHRACPFHHHLDAIPPLSFSFSSLRVVVAHPLTGLLVAERLLTPPPAPVFLSPPLLSTRKKLAMPQQIGRASCRERVF